MYLLHLLHVVLVALNKVYEKANSVRTAVVEAPVWIHKYIIGRKGVNIKKITQEMPKVNVEFTGKEDKIKIEGPPEEVEKAQNELQLMANDLIAKLTFTELNVDPRFYKHIIGKNGCNGKLIFIILQYLVYLVSAITYTIFICNINENVQIYIRNLLFFFFFH